MNLRCPLINLDRPLHVIRVFCYHAATWTGRTSPICPNWAGRVVSRTFRWSEAGSLTLRKPQVI
jgi:hypothetical protein